MSRKKNYYRLWDKKEVLYPELDNILKDTCINLKKVLNKKQRKKALISNPFQQKGSPCITIYSFTH